MMVVGNEKISGRFWPALSKWISAGLNLSLRNSPILRRNCTSNSFGHYTNLAKTVNLLGHFATICFWIAIPLFDSFMNLFSFCTSSFVSFLTSHPPHTIITLNCQISDFNPERFKSPFLTTELISIVSFLHLSGLNSSQMLNVHRSWRATWAETFVWWICLWEYKKFHHTTKGFEENYLTTFHLQLYFACEVWSGNFIWTNL